SVDSDRQSIADSFHLDSPPSRRIQVAGVTDMSLICVDGKACKSALHPCKPPSTTGTIFVCFSLSGVPEAFFTPQPPSQPQGVRCNAAPLRSSAGVESSSRTVAQTGSRSPPKDEDSLRSPKT